MAGTDRHADVKLRAGTRLIGLEIDRESVVDGRIDSGRITEIRANVTQEFVVARVVNLDDTSVGDLRLCRRAGLVAADRRT